MQIWSYTVGKFVRLLHEIDMKDFVNTFLTIKRFAQEFCFDDFFWKFAFANISDFVLTQMKIQPSLILPFAFQFHVHKTHLINCLISLPIGLF